RYAALAGGEKSDAANNQHLVSQLASHDNRRACYVAVLVYVKSADDPRPLIAEGSWQGEIIDQPRGANGFGYDPHFYLPELDKTVAELEPTEKKAQSHRAQALQVLLRALRERAA